MKTCRTWSSRCTRSSSAPVLVELHRRDALGFRSRKRIGRIDGGMWPKIPENSIGIEKPRVGAAQCISTEILDPKPITDHPVLPVFTAAWSMDEEGSRIHRTRKDVRTVCLPRHSPDFRITDTGDLQSVSGGSNVPTSRKPRASSKAAAASFDNEAVYCSESDFGRVQRFPLQVTGWSGRHPSWSSRDQEGVTRSRHRSLHHIYESRRHAAAAAVRASPERPAATWRRRCSSS